MKQLTQGIWHRVLVLSMCAVLFSAATLKLRAQQDAAASISGNIVDSRGAAVANASVVAKNQTTDAISKATPLASALIKISFRLMERRIQSAIGLPACRLPRDIAPLMDSS